MFVCASDAQVELIESQLDGKAEVAVEPMRRDTFPAVMLSCAYLLSKKGAKEDDVVAFLPVDPYTTIEFFNRIKSGDASKLVVVIDEFQLIAKKDASFMESIEKLRMKRLYPGPVLILLCSSSVAWV